MIDVEIEIKDDTLVSSFSNWFCGGTIYWDGENRERSRRGHKFGEWQSLVFDVNGGACGISI